MNLYIAIVDTIQLMAELVELFILLAILLVILETNEGGDQHHV